MVEKFDFKDAEKGNFNNQMGSRKMSNRTTVNLPWL